MKKYLYAILSLAVVGAALAGLLVRFHFYPTADLSFISCGDGFSNPCLLLSQSRYATLLGIPVAVYGLLFYIVLIFTLLVADYARWPYEEYALALVLPLTALAVLVDVALGVILAVSRIACSFCIATYVVNVGLLALALLWYRHAAKRDGVTLMSLLRNLVTTSDDASHKRAFLASFFLFVFALTLALSVHSLFMTVKTGRDRQGPRISTQDRDAFLKNFYTAPVEDLGDISNGLSLGNPKAKVTIVAFTDFLCSACYGFYQAEKYLFTRFGDKVRILYFHYPLDQACNKDVKRSVYPNACIAARAFTGAAQAGILKEYVIAHFAEYERFHSGYTMANALDIFRTASRKGASNLNEEAYARLIMADDVDARVKRHIDMAIRLKITATPTLFIAGRRSVGVPPLEILDALVKKELGE